MLGSEGLGSAIFVVRAPLEARPIEFAYAGTPVSRLTEHEQGRLCQEWAAQPKSIKHH